MNMNLRSASKKGDQHTQTLVLHISQRMFVFPEVYEAEYCI